ncbi:MULTISPECIES: RHS repeat-associated core domain-containing protein [unclassified Pseudomonas]|uniref:RHS repeat-associated core domain-containing protein n=1 Tax=unclassified Pseudomonas TaxID=196821 RepID=UPI000D3C7E3C|nr:MULTISPECIES: RHS repeat-associated core domain-containing protein [unclassified Pseudomonas]RAU47056.1 RHS repeat-associated core domain-containing protein [Pseudomonas sp. RIT 409]RAU54673.1 RHS repeat-associated core domain-containing protein [Pseudomonas sp. RIT 412]
MSNSASSVHSATPGIRVFDPRALVVSTVEFHRAAADAIAEPRAHYQRYDRAGRLISAYDPRLGRTLAAQEGGVPNRSYHRSLSGTVLLSQSVDAGWVLNLAGEAGESRVVWDGRGHVHYRVFDDELRLTTVLQQTTDGFASVVERMTYGGPKEHHQNLCGRLARHDDMAGTLQMSCYDLAGNVAAEQRRFLKTLDDPDWPSALAARDGLLEIESAETCRVFNALSEPLRWIDARQNIQRFEYDIGGHLHRVSLQLSGAEPRLLLSQVRFNALDQIVSETAGNGVVTSAQFCPQSGRLLHLESGLPGGAAIQCLAYQYDPVGNVTRVDDGVKPSVFFRNQQISATNTYAYDSLYQLIEATGFEFIRSEGWRSLTGAYLGTADPGQLANYCEQYAYDSAGNLQTVVHSGAQAFTRRMITSATSNRSLLVQGDWTPDEQDIAKGFDANGNQQALFRGQALEWDVCNRLRQITPVIRDDGSTDSERYVYDASGQRVRKVRLVGGIPQVRRREVRYLPGLEIHSDSVGDTAWHTVEVHAGRNRVFWTQWVNGAPSTGRDSFARFSLTNHQGSATLECDETGTLLSQEHYYPYGGTAWWAQAQTTAAGFKTRRYSGKEQDVSGLYDYGARYYAPWLGRWINPDPGEDVDGLNRYRFVSNNPATMTDPDGREGTVTLLYGFDPARDKYLEGGSEASSRSIVTIDLLNAGIGISPDTVMGYYGDVIEPFFDGNAEEGDDTDDRQVPEEGVDIFLEKATHYKGSREQAHALLQSWSDFLYAHNERFNVRNKIKRYDERPEKWGEFWRKNMRMPLSQQGQGAMAAMLQKDPEALFGGSSSAMEHAAEGVTNWIFRRISKLGLDWAHSDSATLPADVEFVDVGLSSPADASSGWEDLNSTHYNSRRYKTISSDNTYEPITYSERRHVERNKAQMSKVRFIRMNQLHH